MWELNCIIGFLPASWTLSITLELMKICITENMLETATSYARRKEEEDSRRNVVSITDDSEDCSLYHALFLGGKKQL